MNEKIFLKSVITSSMLILALLLVDTYLIPTADYKPEVIESKQYVRIGGARYRRGYGGRSGRGYTYSLRTQHRSITIQENLYRELMPADTILINSSGLLSSPQYLLQRDGENYLRYSIGYIRAAAGLELVIALLIGHVITFIFFNRFPWEPGRRRLVYVLLTLAISQLCFCLFYLK
jgi:hypothetical protein